MPFDGTEKGRAGLPEAALALILVEQSLEGGRHWLQGEYEADDDMCLVGALQSVHARDCIAVDWATRCLVAAIREHGFFCSIEQFNDSCADYDALLGVLRRAQALALQDAGRPGASGHAPCVAG